MKSELTKLYNTLLLVETRGESTKIMGDCLRFVEQMLVEQNSEKQVINDTVEMD